SANNEGAGEVFGRGGPDLLRAACGALEPAALAGRRVYGLGQRVGSDYTHARFPTTEIADQRSEERESNCERRGPIDGIEEPQVIGVVRAVSAELFAPDRVIGIALGDTLPQKALSPAVRFGDLRSVSLKVHGDVLPQRQDELACLFRNRECEVEDFV